MTDELQYRPFDHDDWGMIRNADGSMHATVRRPEAYEGEFDQHRTEQTDPFADLARRIIFFGQLEQENAELRTGIKRLSDEEELCAETTGDDPFSMVYLAAKLADAEAEIKHLRASLDDSQNMHLSALRRLCIFRDALAKISSPTQTEGLLWWQVEAREALAAANTSASDTAKGA